MKQLWFKAKTYGYGWYPVTWQGWLVILIYVLGVAGFGFWYEADPVSRQSTFISGLIFMAQGKI